MCISECVMHVFWCVQLCAVSGAVSGDVSRVCGGCGGCVCAHVNVTCLTVISLTH